MNLESFGYEPNELPFTLSRSEFVSSYRLAESPAFVKTEALLNFNAANHIGDSLHDDISKAKNDHT